MRFGVLHGMEVGVGDECVPADGAVVFNGYLVEADKSAFCCVAYLLAYRHRTFGANGYFCTMAKPCFALENQFTSNF